MAHTRVESAFFEAMADLELNRQTFDKCGEAEPGDKSFYEEIKIQEFAHDSDSNDRSILPKQAPFQQDDELDSIVKL